MLIKDIAMILALFGFIATIMIGIHSATNYEKDYITSYTLLNRWKRLVDG